MATDQPPVHAHVTSVRPGEPYVDLRQYVEALFREKERALEMAADERERAAQNLRDSITRRIDESYERLHELVVTLFAEKDRALQMAAAEREKAAKVLREERHRALLIAETEREKAAHALREALSRAIAEGDERLREHIQNQVAQINAALRSGELLELERIRGVHDELIALIDANTREFRQIQLASMAAVEKAEEAQQRVNIGQNEFRGQLSDQAATLMPRRESEAKHEAHVVAIRELREELGKLRTELAVGPPGLSEISRDAAAQQGQREAKGASQATLISIFIALGAVGLVLVELFRSSGHA